VAPEALHTIEHLAATYLRNDAEWARRVVYWGPMGCCTGNYLIVQGEVEPMDVLPLVRRAMEFVAGYDGEIPGATPRDCGNYSYMDLAGARAAASRYVEVLNEAGAERMTYPE
jgi:S-ribosylhomocysteine lyase